jgi:hypothetical protein
VLLPLPPPPVPLARVPHSHQILSALRPLGVQDQINMAQINMARQRQAQEQLTQDARLAEQFRRAAQRQQHAAAGPDHFQAYAQVGALLHMHRTPPPAPRPHAHASAGPATCEETRPASLAAALTLHALG